MKKLKIFLDTSVYSSLFDNRIPNRQKMTQDFWNNIGDYELYYSEIILEEINAVSNENLKKDMKNLLKDGEKLKTSTEVENLTQIYIKEGLIPEKYENDAVLIALTSVYSLDILVSWNFKHLVKRKTRIGVNLINLKNGYKTIEILAPPEL
ncbi:MAG: PIN domain-containing protein [Promethearchaeota archaeon]|nr:MAG: PIN domain-containing protein [Candidatus Lokiarchaeota archaeon]